MKRAVLLALAAILAISGMSEANAGPRKETRDARFKENFPFKYEVSLGWSGYPILDDYMWGGGWGCQACQDMAALHQTNNLSHLYRTVNAGEYMTGMISGEFNIHFKRWFTLSLEAGINGLWGSRHNRLDGEVVQKMNGAVVSIIPQAQFNWFNRKNVRLYSGIGAGISAGAYDDEVQAYVAAQLTPVGITVGRKIFFFAEQSIGTAYMGGKAGVGYRF